MWCPEYPEAEHGIKTLRATLPKEKGFRQFEWAPHMEVFLKPSLLLSPIPNKCLMGVLNSYFYLGESPSFFISTMSKEARKERQIQKLARLYELNT